MVCSLCGLPGHNKKTCGKYNNSFPTTSAFYHDHKKIVQKNYTYAKQKQKESGRKGAVFPKTKDPFKGYCTFMK